MSCEHGNWPPCVECDEEDAAWNMAFAAGKDSRNDEIERLRAALEACEHETHSLRVQSGNAWAYHPFQVGRIAEIARSALTLNVKVKGPEAALSPEAPTRLPGSASRESEKKR